MNTSDTNRPLSPHLQVYKLPYNARMSIAGRVVGIGLFISASVIFAWFSAAVWNPSLFDATMAFLKSDAIINLMTIKLIFGVFVVCFYLGNGVRHVLWDLVIGVKPACGRMTGNVVLLVSALITAGIAALIYG
ncbi:MAG: succinate dehydrogenase, cytochrome b556 subunit [Alphaproteobacteria bacterium]